MTQNFADKLAASIDRVGAPACVGLDPNASALPENLRGLPLPKAYWDFSVAVIDAVAPHVAAIKFQSACYEALGPDGIESMHLAMQHATNLGLTVILDAKRGDIGVTAERYAQAAFTGPAPADALTVNAYLGFDTIEPYLKHAGKGLFILVRTSNPGSDAIQSQALADGRTIAQLMADHVARLGASRLGTCGLSDIGAVVAATKPADASELRRRMPNTIFLVPGYGAQGGTLEDIKNLWRSSGGGGKKNPASTSGVLITASRSVIYAFGLQDEDWTEGVSKAAAKLNQELRGV